MKKKFLLVGLLFMNFVLACGRVPIIGPPTETKLATASEKDCGFVQNSYGQRVSWKQSLPIKMYIDPSFPAEYDAVLNAAAQRWENVLGRTLFVFERSTQAVAPGKDNRNVIYWMNPWTEESKTLQAVSALSWKKNQLVETDMKVNAQYNSFYLNSAVSNKDIHLESLLVHEFGHILGLKHLSNTTPSVMLQVLDYLLKREAPSTDDQANLKCEYR